MEMETLWNKYGHNAFVYALNKWKVSSPNDYALNWIDAEGKISNRMTYQELFDKLSQLSAYLIEELKLSKGDRVIICFPPGLEFVIAFFACICNGIIAVPVYPADPSKGKADVPKLCGIIEASGSRTLLTSTSYKRLVQVLFPLISDSRWQSATWICIDSVINRQTKADAKQHVFPRLKSDDIAFLQFTSGSTSNPKGVMVTHGNVLYNCQVCWSAFMFPSDLDSDGKECFSILDYNFYDYLEFWEARHAVSIKYRGHRVHTFSWLPVYHDMGLIGFLCAPILCGASLHQMSPMDFIRRPHLWLKCMSDYHCVCCAAPNFAFGYALRKMPDDVIGNLDLSHVCGMLSGAEPVKYETVRNFTEKFQKVGFRSSAIQPAFGLAEHTLIVTGSKNWRSDPTVITTSALSIQPGQPIEILTEVEVAKRPASSVKRFVGCGFPLHGISIHIVDTNHNEVKDGYAGEIFIHSPSNASGYYNMPELTKEIFKAWFTKLDGSMSESCFLRTGDIGFMHNGELFVCGRIKDVIIIRGRNYYPQDVEDAIEKVSVVRKGCSTAFAIDNGRSEALAVAAEIRVEDGLKGLWGRFISRKSATASYEQIVTDICSSIATELGLKAEKVWLLRPRSLYKTSSGKLRRAYNREQLLAGTFPGLLYENILPEQRRGSLTDDGGVTSTASSNMVATIEQREKVTVTPAMVDDQATAMLPEKFTGTSPCMNSMFHRTNNDGQGSSPQVVEKVTNAVLESAKSVLGSESLPELNTPLIELGVDSVAAVEFAELLSHELELHVEPTLAFNYPTPADIIDFLVKELEGTEAGGSVSFGIASSEAIAICGASCQLPGGASTMEAFWEVLSEGLDAIVEVPRSRWDIDEYYDADPDEEGKMYIRESGFIKNAEMFDAAFFKISHSEAKAMDPQQRLLLEVAFECLHNSGYTKENLQRAPIGVFVGCCSNDWYHVCTQINAGVNSYSATSHSPSIIANRVSYTLGLVGPSVTIDTACSSSLVAIHLAALELLNGNCAASLACGVNLMLSPMITVACCKARMMSPDARCKTFDASANGYVRGEGIGAILMKPLSKAQADGNNIYCIIRGTAVNHGGKAASLTAPNGLSQQRVIYSALHQAQMKPSMVQFIEAHGTGTSLGDPIEVGALRSVFGRDRDSSSPLIVGAVKTNLGHLEGAAGMASILKTLLAFKHQEIPRNLHFKQLNPHIVIKDFNVRFPDTSSPWITKAACKRVAGVSSFGFGGTNGHVILEEAPTECQEADKLTGESAPVEPVTAFLFGGLGHQHINMGRDLYESYPAFANIIKMCSEYAGDLLDVPLVDVLYPEEADRQRAATLMRDTRYAQAALYAVHYAMATYWSSMGVKPDVVMGVGAGELAAAAYAGMFTVKDGLKVVIERSTIIASLPTDEGVMVACRASEEEVEFAVAEIGNENCRSVSVAIVYGPKSVVLSGRKAEVEHVLLKLNLLGRCKYLDVPYAYGSKLLDGAVPKLMKLISDCKLSSPTLKIISGSTGEFADETIMNSSYWSKSVSECVYFQHGIHTAVSDGCKIFVELGPKPVLIKMGQQNVTNQNLTWISSMEPGKSNHGLREAGLDQFRKACTHLNNQRREEESIGKPGNLLYHRQAFPWTEIPHPFVTKVKQVFDKGEVMFEAPFPRRAISLFSNHIVNGQIIMPGTALVETTLAASHAMGWSNAANFVCVEDVQIVFPLRIGSVRPTTDLTTRPPLRSTGGRTPKSSRAAGRPTDIQSRSFQKPDEVCLTSPKTSIFDSNKQMASPVSPKVTFKKERRKSTPSQGTISEMSHIDKSLALQIAEKLSVSESDAHTAGGSAMTGKLSIVCAVDSSRTATVSSKRDDDSSDLTEHLHAKIIMLDASEGKLEPFENISSRCKEAVDVAALYEYLYDIGLQYGPRFRTIQCIYKGENEAVANLEAVSDESFDSFESGFFFHPAILDGALQVSAVFAEEKYAGKKTLIPTSMGRVAAKKFNPHSDCWVHVKLLKKSKDSMTIDVALYNDTFDNVGFISNVLLRAADLSAGFSVEIPKELLWKVDWEEKKFTKRLAKSFAPVLYLGADEFIRNEIYAAYEAINARQAVAVFDMPSESELENLLTAHPWMAIVYVGPLTATKQNPVDVLYKAHKISKTYGTVIAVNNSGCPLWFITENCKMVTAEYPAKPINAGLWSYALTVRNELSTSLGTTVQIGCIDLPSVSSLKEMPTLLEQCSISERKNEFESDLVLRKGITYVPRLALCTEKVLGAKAIVLHERGALSNLRLEPLPFYPRHPVTEFNCTIRVRSVGLNFRDVLNVMGLYPGDPGPPGGDCAGTVVAVGEDVSHIKVGDSVFGIAPGCLKTYVTTDARLMRKLPHGMSFEEASALPVVASTVELALHDMAAVEKGERVLIHAGSGGVGLTAIQYCQRVGAIVYATCGSEQKKEYLKSLGVEFVTSSRDVEQFKQDMHEFLSDGSSIDVVLNSLIDDYIPASLAVMKKGGRFMELGKRSIWSHDKMQQERPDIYYETIAVDVMMEHDPEWFGGMLDRIRRRVETEELTALPLHTFDMTSSVDGAIAGFRFLQRAQHIGKVVIRIPSAVAGEGEPMEEAGTFVVTGGLGGLGLVFAKWLAEEGIHNIILTSRSVTPSEMVLQSEVWKWLTNSSIHVEHMPCDVSKYDEVKNLFKQIEDKGFPAVRGILHAAGVTADALLPNQTKAMMEAVYRPKVMGAWNLHNVCEEMGINKDLRVFMMFSSVAALLGNYGQANYAAANACLDALVQWRRSKGLCGQSIQWGPWLEQGMAYELRHNLEKVGMKGITNDLGLRVMHDVMKHTEYAVVGCQAFSWQKFVKRYHVSPLLLSEISFGSTRNQVTIVDVKTMPLPEIVELVAKLAQSTSGSGELAKAETKLMDLGLDSLGAVEFRNSIDEVTGVKLPQSLLFEDVTVQGIAEVLKNGEPAAGKNVGNTSKAKTHGEAAITKEEVPIDEWLMSALEPGERFQLYIEAFTHHYGSVEKMSVEDDIISALELLGVEDTSDFDSLFVAWNELVDSRHQSTSKVITAAAANKEVTGAIIKKKATPYPTKDVKMLVDGLKFDVKSLQPATCVTEAKNVLLTGATGFVGRVQLACLLNHDPKSGMMVHCIVRAKSAEHAMERIRVACIEAKCWDPKFVERIVAIPGNFAEPYLGIQESKFAELASKIDMVYHTGGDVNLLNNYSRLRETNTLSMNTIIQLCTTTKLKPLHFVSTLGQFPAFFALFNCEYENHVINEDSQPDQAEMEALFPPSRQGYPWSKWAAEQVVFKAQELGLPVAIYRLPNTFAAWSTGYTNISDYAAALTIASIREGIFPVGAATAPLTPVDTICEMLVQISMKANRKHSVFHLFDPRILLREDVEAWSKELGIGYKGVTLDEFMTVIKSRGFSCPLFKFIPLLQHWRKYWYDAPEKPVNFPIRNQNTFDEVPHMKWPELRDIFKNSVLYCVNQNFFPKDSASITLDVDTLVNDARAMSGFTSFGDEHYFMEPVRLLSKSLLTECDPSFAGKLATYRTFRQYAMNIMYMEDAESKCPGILQQTITQPLIIVGLNRSGTTFLQQLLSLDNSNRTARYCEMIQPFGTDGKYRPHGLPNDPNSWKTDPRVATAQEVLDSQLGLSEEWQGIHKQQAELPEEDFIIFEHCFRSYSICAEFNVPSYRKWLMNNECEEMKKGYSFHKRFLKHLQWQRKGERWVLKMPFHMFCLSAVFESYPDAMIVFMHRDPKDTMGSWSSLVRHAQEQLLSSVETSLIGPTELEAMSTMMNSALKFRSSNPSFEKQFCDIQYEDLIADPIGMVKRIYRHFKLKIYPSFIDKMYSFGKQNRKAREKLVKHSYNLQDVGLNSEVVDEAFSNYYSQNLLARNK